MLTPLGFFHTIVSSIAIISGIWTLIAHKEISLRNASGKTYLIMTFVSAASALGIFQHGGFGAPHVLALLTIFALVIGSIAALTSLFGKISRYVQLISYSTTILFHMIPGFTESLTRLPVGNPVLESPEAPAFKVIYGILFALFFIGLALQILWLRKQNMTDHKLVIA